MSAETKKRTGENNLLWKVAILFVIVATGGAMFLYINRDWSAPGSAKRLQNPVLATDESIAMGRMVYMARCQNCHGDNGDGKGPHADSLSLAPSDFTDAHAMSLVSDGELFWKISHGRRPMPAFQDKLSETERWQLVDFIRTFTQKANSGVAPGTNGNSP